MTGPVHQQLQNILNQCVQDTTTKFAGIQLLEQDECLLDDMCTVHTVLEGQCPAALLLYANTPMLTKLAQNIIHSESVSQQDIEDVATEYFNVVCGRIVAKLFQATKVPSRFQAPRFMPGCYLPDNKTPCRCVLSYTDDGSTCMQLIYMGLHTPASTSSPQAS